MVMEGDVEHKHYDQVLNIQRFDLHRIATKQLIIRLSDVTQWVSHHTYFRQLAIIGYSGNVLGFLTQGNF